MSDGANAGADDGVVRWASGSRFSGNGAEVGTSEGPCEAARGPRITAAGRAAEFGAPVRAPSERGIGGHCGIHDFGGNRLGGRYSRYPAISKL